MKRILEVIKREQKLPLFAIVLSMFVLGVILLTGPLVVYHTSTQLFSTPFGELANVQQLFMLYAGLISVVVVVAIAFFRSDRLIRHRLQDEREVAHEYLIADKSYKVLVLGLVIFTLYTASIYITGLLLLTIVYRLYLRYKLNTIA